MTPLYSRLSDPELLKRCVPGLTQNQNESLNATIWKRCPKEKNFGAKFVNRAVASATLAWNTGAKSQIRVLTALSLPVFPFTRTAAISKDLKRVYYAKQQLSTEKKRKNMKLLKANKKVAAKRLFGTDYVPGQE